jgi:hypothetical protein
MLGLALGRDGQPAGAAPAAGLSVRALQALFDITAREAKGGSQQRTLRWDQQLDALLCHAVLGCALPCCEASGVLLCCFLTACLAKFQSGVLLVQQQHEGAGRLQENLGICVLCIFNYLVH